MPTWLVILLVLVAVVPGAVVILMGVVAMFVMPTREPVEGAAPGPPEEQSPEP